MVKIKGSQDIPKTGRIGRFSKIVETKTPEEVYLRVMEKSSEYGNSKPEQKSLWWNNAVTKLENEVGTNEAIQIMRACGRKCCGKGQRKTAKRLMDESGSVEEFLDRLSKHDVREGELEYTLLNQNTIVGKHNKCFCGQVKKAKQLFKTPTYCQCSVEFNKQFFEAAFEKPVTVELKQSIITGGDFCEFLITINE